MSAPEVPFFCAAGATFGVDLLACMATVVQQGRYVLGPQAQAFESAFAPYGVHAWRAYENTKQRPQAITLSVQRFDPAYGNTEAAAR
jgi:hypothetical protein